MVITSEHIRKELKRIWRDLRFIWPTNPMWDSDIDRWLPKIIENCSVKHFIFTPGIFECENYARSFVAKVYKYQYDLYHSGEYKPKWRWAIGYSMGIKSDIFGNATVHGMVIMVTEKRVIIYEPQEDTYLDHNYRYVPFFVEF